MCNYLSPMIFLCTGRSWVYGRILFSIVSTINSCITCIKFVQYRLQNPVNPCALIDSALFCDNEGRHHNLQYSNAIVKFTTLYSKEQARESWIKFESLKADCYVASVTRSSHMINSLVVYTFSHLW